MRWVIYELAQLAETHIWYIKEDNLIDMRLVFIGWQQNVEAQQSGEQKLIIERHNASVALGSNQCWAGMSVT